MTIPVAALEEAHLKPGDELRVEVAGDGRLVLVRVADPLEKFIGSMPGLERDVDLQALGDEWDR